MDETEAADAQDLRERKPLRDPPVSLGLLIFVFGTAAGFLLAFSGLGVIEDGVGILLLVFLSALMFIAAFGLVIYLFRKPLLRRLFGLANTQLELFAKPLVDVARSAVDRDPKGAVEAARDLAHLSLARYAWLSTRRWIIGSLTALIAAMAALAGTAMLYRQNQLLQDQSVLLAGQNERIDQQIVQINEQITLDSYSVQLAEAARNAQLVVEITDIAGELGRVLDRIEVEMAAEQGRKVRSITSIVPNLDPLQDLDMSLILRISAASRATKPYRFLDVGLNSEDDQTMIRDALYRRAEEFPKAWKSLNGNAAVPESLAGTSLVDRPASPERGQLLTAMTLGGIRSFETLTFFGLDLSFAFAQGIWLQLPSFQVARLSYADFSYSEIRQGEFGGAFLQNARFRKARIHDTSFAAISGTAIKPPFSDDKESIYTSLAGADFSESFLLRVNFAEINGIALQFDDAVLVEPDFTKAVIRGATFRGTVLLGEKFEGADLGGADFDGAIVTGADFLDRTAAASGSLDAEAFKLEPISMDEALDVSSLGIRLEINEIEEYVGGAGLFRVSAVKKLD